MNCIEGEVFDPIKLVCTKNLDKCKYMKLYSVIFFVNIIYVLYANKGAWFSFVADMNVC